MSKRSGVRSAPPVKIVVQKYLRPAKDHTDDKCDTVFQVEQTTRGRRSRATTKHRRFPAAAAAAVNENSEVEAEDGDPR